MELTQEEKDARLKFAVREDNLQSVTELLSLGANPNTVDTEGRNCLHDAAMYKSTNVVAPLLKFISDINAKNNSGYTALHTAIWMGYEKITKDIIHAGAKVYTKNNKGISTIASCDRLTSRPVINNILNALTISELNEVIEKNIMPHKEKEINKLKREKLVESTKNKIHGEEIEF
jgi:ankyrin repeat protein